MAPKRKNEGGEPTARERKKQKIAVARTIAVQSTTTPTSTSENAVAGPSNLRAVTFDSMKGLPSTIDVEKFAEARAFEINAMQNAMENASGNSGQRAWQTLPRHLRRRAASHDVRRVPLRLRERARAEMDPARRKALGRSMPKRGKANRISRTDALLKRQRDKTWLETHIWHAKRMKMKNMWSYRLALHPTEKSFRPSHRASVHGSILHDASYYSLIELKGSEQVLRTLLEICCDPQGQGPGAKRFLTGTRVLDTHIYKPGSYPFDLIAPITIMWKPCQPNADKSSSKDLEPTEEQRNTKDTSTFKKKKRQRKGKGKESTQNIQQSSNQAPSLDTDPRIVWVRSHPAVFDEVFSALQISASSTLETIKQSSSTAEVPSVEVEIADLREQINVFEIMGPKSSQVLRGALTPVGEDKREEFKKFWSSLTDLQTSGSLPRGMVIGFKVHDPRLKFPPKNAKPRVDESGLPHMSSPITTFPTSILAQSEIWDEGTRKGLQKPRFKKKDLDDRRSKNLIPGTHLNPLRQDNRIPVLLIQRSLENQASTSHSQSIHGWTLIIPSGWSMPFFSSLIYTGTRVGGQRERQTQSFEAGCAYFPRDYPFTDAYSSYVEQRADQEKDRWERKPPAKRANFEKLGTRSPWKPDWDVVLGLEALTSDDLVTTQREEPLTASRKIIRPWVLRGVGVPAILDTAANMFNHGAGLLAEINKLRTKRLQDPLETSIRPEDLWRGALVMVRIVMCGRGAPEDHAIIYNVDDDEAKKWDDVIERKKRHSAAALDEESVGEVELSSIQPSQDSIIGYITSGNFSLSRGEGFTIGAIPVARLFELKQQAQRLKHPSSLVVKVRDCEGDKCRIARLEILES